MASKVTAALLLTVSAFVICGGTAAASAPQRLTELPSPNQASSPQGLTEVNGTLFFTAFDETHGAELWKSDGTEGGTELVKDISPGSASAFPQSLTAVNGTLYFVATDEAHGAELWKSDGTEAGTELVRDIAPGSSMPEELVAVEGTLYFVATDEEHGTELWKSDGKGGVELVEDIFSGPTSLSPQHLTAVNGTLFFVGYDEAHSQELWKSDGTEAGTELVEDINPGPAFSFPPDNLTAVNGTLFFTAYEEAHGIELWKSDGTEAGTELVKDTSPGSSSMPKDLTEFNGVLYFLSSDENVGVSLFKSDGTEAGTEVVKTILPENAPTLGRLTASGGLLYFTSTDFNAKQLWRSDGTAGGTEAIQAIAAGPDAEASFVELTDVAGTLFFRVRDNTTGAELWRSDGSEAGTELVRDIRAGAASSTPSELTAVGATVFFAAEDASHGIELWRSDGTGAGTSLVKDVNTAPGFGEPVLSNLTSVGSLAFFSAKSDEAGTELWKSDGTPGGTELVEDIRPEGGSSPQELTNVNGTLFFTAYDDTNGNELWKSDGTPAGTELVEDINSGPLGSNPAELVSVEGTLFFRAEDGIAGAELWKSDGTPAGTELVEDINPGGPGSFPRELSAADGILLFNGNDGAAGEELWASDGTPGGTEMVRDINPGPAGSSPSWRFPPLITRRLYSLPLYFSAEDGEHGFELWRTDGTEAGTELLKDINSGPGSAAPLAGFLEFSGLTFFVAEDGVHGVEPWQTDGTSGGTRLGKDINPGVAASLPTAREVVNGIIYFNASDGEHGYELWRSDGTEPGTSLVKDINPGAAGGFVGPSLPLNSELTELGGTLYFSADDGASGEELWQSDGQEAGTQILSDINPGAGSSAPRKLITVGNKLFFLADDGSGVGQQLWSLEVTLSDSDSDGIADNVDTEPANPSNDFSDKAAPTYGTIADRAGLDVKVSDAASTDGVRIVVGAGAGQATIEACGGYTLHVKAASEAFVTCGSIKVEVVTGAAEIVVDNGQTVISVPAGATAKVSENEDGSYKVENLGGGDVTVTSGGEETPIEPGDPPLVLEPPVAVEDKLKVNEDAPATAVDVLANDTDPDGGAKTIVSATQPPHGDVVVTGSGASLTYRPDHDYCGADAFEYGLNGGSTATVSVTVKCAEDSPTAVSDSVSGLEDHTVKIRVLANDTDADGGRIRIVRKSNPSHGTARIGGYHRRIYYTPDHDYCGPDSFTYTLNGGSTATVSVTVICVNDPPDTEITNQPKKEIKISGGSKASVQFSFVSSEPGSTFRCRLDHQDAFAPCNSPASYSLGARDYDFEVYAIDSEGLPDPTPDHFSFEVRKK